MNYHKISPISSKYHVLVIYISFNLLTEEQRNISDRIGKLNHSIEVRIPKINLA